MKIESLEFGATIPTQQYGNIQPRIAMSDVELEEGTKLGLNFINGLFDRYSEKGGLIPRETVKATGLKKSFNEDVQIAFDPLGHTYFYGDKQLTGATEYIKRFYKPFDAETISGVLEDKWQVTQAEIKEIWDMNGGLTSEFGSLVHTALEFYHNHNVAGEKIAKAKGESTNYVLPKHPILKQIVQDFLKIDNRKGKIINEVLITNVSKGICGHADAIEIIDEKKKICRVGDYKVNINSQEIDNSQKVLAPFSSLPSNKLSKYQLQLSVYGNMLEASGWTVEGLDVYVYEDGWKHYPLPLLKVI